MATEYDPPAPPRDQAALDTSVHGEAPSCLLVRVDGVTPPVLEEPPGTGEPPGGWIRAVSRRAGPLLDRLVTSGHHGDKILADWIQDQAVVIFDEHGPQRAMAFIERMEREADQLVALRAAGEAAAKAPPQTHGRTTDEAFADLGERVLELRQLVDRYLQEPLTEQPAPPPAPTLPDLGRQEPAPRRRRVTPFWHRLLVNKRYRHLLP